jgi:hypothetical protein
VKAPAFFLKVSISAENVFLLTNVVKKAGPINNGVCMMKTNAAAIFGVVSLSFGAMAGEKNIPLTFLDTLNKGKELSISEDFAPPSFPVMTKTPAASADTVAANAKTAPKPEAGVVVSRFRIQVLASTHEDQVKREKNTLTSKIDIPVTITFESPYYKLFAGEFTQRSEAENYLAQIKKLGYNDAWISRTVAPQK